MGPVDITALLTGHRRPRRIASGDPEVTIRLTARRFTLALGREARVGAAELLAATRLVSRFQRP